MVYKVFFKRFFDVLMAIIAMGILFIPMVMIGLLIKLTSKGPIFFVQERYGYNSLKFKLYKFRSMVDNAPQLANSEFDNIRSYMTPFGMFIRKTSIDELPQIWNIIKGDMSFIGPRPLASTDGRVIYLRKINGADKVLPGISGLAQVNGRNNILDEDKAAYDAEYATKLNFRLDLWIIWKTCISVVRRRDVFKDDVQ